MADQELLEKYGDTRNIKYLINSLDDLRDVTDTIIHMIKSNCQDDDLRAILDSLDFKAIPINASKSSFIIILNFPARFLESTGQRLGNIRG